MCAWRRNAPYITHLSHTLPHTFPHTSPGNISSSSIWYVLAYLETFPGVRRGARIWQMGFGSGFKCNSAVWKSLRNIKDPHRAWEGFQVQQLRDYLAWLKSSAKKRE